MIIQSTRTNSVENYHTPTSRKSPENITQFDGYINTENTFSDTDANADALYSDYINVFNTSDDTVLSSRSLDEDSHPNERLQKRYLQFGSHRDDRRHHFHSEPTGDDPLPRPFGHILNGMPPSEFQPQPNHTFPGIPKDYTGAVNSIRDILDQVSANALGPLVPNIESTSRPPSPETLAAYVARSGRKIRFGGTYRHRKADGQQQHFAEQMPAYRVHPNPTPSSNVPALRDPFYAYKPHKLGDINLLATRSLRFAPVPMTTPNHHSMEYTVRQRSQRPQTISDPADLYQQLIAANNLRAHMQRTRPTNSRVGDPKRSAKPFSLMLDVYPVPEEEPTTSTARPANPRPMLRKPQVHPIAQAVNNLPLHMMDEQYFQSMHFPQVRPTRHNPMEYSGVYANQMQLHPQADQQQAHPYYNFNRLGPSKLHPPAENQPSTITVHLNLYPKQKKNQRRIVPEEHVKPATRLNPRRPYRHQPPEFTSVEEQMDDTESPAIDMYNRKAGTSEIRSIDDEINARRPHEATVVSQKLLFDKKPDTLTDSQFENSTLTPHLTT